MPISKYCTHSNSWRNNVQTYQRKMQKNLSTMKISMYAVVDCTEMVHCAAEMWRIKQALVSIRYMYTMLLMHVKLPFPPPLPHLTEPHSCDQHFSLDMSVTHARLLCLSTLTSLAHITFSVGVLHTVQEICKCMYFWQIALVCNIWNTYCCLFGLC